MFSGETNVELLTQLTITPSVQDSHETVCTRADLAAWQLPGGPVGPASRWAATSNQALSQDCKFGGSFSVWGG